MTRLSADGHAKNVKAYGSMRSVYRRDGDSWRTISGIPNGDQTSRQTLVRMEHTAKVSSKLPNMPGTRKPFALGGMTLVKFTELAGQLRTAIESCEGCDSSVNVSQSGLTALAVEASSFLSAAVTQGRANCDEGTPGRAWIDTVPLEQSTQAPGQAVNTGATSPGAGATHLEFDAPHATSFTLQHKTPGAAEFTTLAGEHLFAVTGRNSRGEGPVSAVAAVRVTVAAVA